MNHGIFIIYLVCLVFVAFSTIRQGYVLFISTNGTRMTQWTFLVFNIAFMFFIIGKLLELAGLDIIYPEEIRACLMFIMATVGFVFYFPKK